MLNISIERMEEAHYETTASQKLRSSMNACGIKGAGEAKCQRSRRPLPQAGKCINKILSGKGGGVYGARVAKI